MNAPASMNHICSSSGIPKNIVFPIRVKYQNSSKNPGVIAFNTVYPKTAIIHVNNPDKIEFFIKSFLCIFINIVGSINDITVIVNEFKDVNVQSPRNRDASNIPGKSS